MIIGNTFSILSMLTQALLFSASISQTCDEPRVYSKFQEAFFRDGYVIFPKLFDNEEIDILNRTIESDTKIPLRKWKMSDGDNRYSDLVIWKYLSNDTYGNFMQSQRIIHRVQQLLECLSVRDVVHYHTKLMLKYAEFGGKFNWHQDYGYWYQNGLLFPDMLTVFIAVDECSQSNGCLQVIKGSHAMGRVDHTLVGGQTGADKERVELVQQHLITLQLELKPGDTLFFHSNLLHASDANTSNKRRYAFLAAYSCRRNPIYKEHHHYYTDIEIQSNDKIKEMGVSPTVSEEIFMDPKGKVDTVIIEQEE